MASIPRLQCALNFFINGISIPQQSFPNISTVPPFQRVLSIFVFTSSCILISTQVQGCAGISCILSHPLPFKKHVRPPGTRPLQPRNRIVFLINKYVRLKHDVSASRTVRLSHVPYRQGTVRLEQDFVWLLWYQTSFKFGTGGIPHRQRRPTLRASAHCTEPNWKETRWGCKMSPNLVLWIAS
jgi:hypothetical protein